MIQLNPEQEKQIWKKYIMYEHKGSNKYIWSFVIGLCLGLALIFLGASFINLTLIIVGASVMVVPSLILRIYNFRFQNFQYRTYTLMERELARQPSFHFSFDSRGIYFKSDSNNVTIRWYSIARYRENDGDIYLYETQKKIFKIISEEKIGKEAYQRFKGLLDREMNLKTNRK